MSAQKNKNRGPIEGMATFHKVLRSLLTSHFVLPTPSSHSESKDYKEQKVKDTKNFYQVEIPLGSRFTGTDELLHNLDSETQDFTE